MQTIKIKKEWLIEAENLYEFKKLKASLNNGAYVVYGAIAEIVAREEFKKKHTVVHADDFDYDFLIDGLFKVDVKSKVTTVVPAPFFVCDVQARQIKQQCDFYFFVRVLESKEEAYLLGYLGKEEFFKKAEFKQKGDKEINGHIYKADCYNVMVKQLREFN